MPASGPARRQTRRAAEKHEKAQRCFSVKKILVIGSANVDFVIGVERTPEQGETILCRSFRKSFGGKGANQAYACGRLGGDAAFLNAVGDDTLGRDMVQNLRKAGVDTDAIRLEKGEPTGMAVVCVDQEGNNSIIVVPGANRCCDIEYLKQNQAYFEDCDIVLLQMEIPYESVCYAVDVASKLHKTVILNPAPAPESLPDSIYEKLDYLTPNESEFKKLTGCPTEREEDLIAYCGQLLDKGTRNVIITLGGRGALLVNRNGHRLYPPPKVKTVDTTAAGDTFNAALARKLADGCSAGEAIVFANYASALAVSKPGAQDSVPSYEEVLTFKGSVE